MDKRMRDDEFNHLEAAAKTAVSDGIIAVVRLTPNQLLAIGARMRETERLLDESREANMSATRNAMAFAEERDEAVQLLRQARTAGGGAAWHYAVRDWLARYDLVHDMGRSTDE